MSTRPLNMLIRHLRHAVGPPGEGTLSDAQLLDRWADRRDEAAFELLLWRHGPMILSVCRRLLRDAQDVEDAFQAAWLVLVRKAGSLRNRGAVAAWLHRVAYRVALRARIAAARRAGRERPGVDVPAPVGADEVAERDLRAVLDEEINRLPARQRRALVLCGLEGMTQAEAARHLGCPQGTLSSWLTRARERLRGRLARRGLALTAGVAATALSEGTASAPVPAPLVVLTVKAAVHLAAGKGTAIGAVSAEVASLTKGVLQAMLLTKLKAAGACLLAVAVAVAVAGAFASAALVAEQPGAKQEDRPKQAEDTGKPALTAKHALEAARKASLAADKIRSAVATGTLEVYVQERGDAKPGLRIKGKVRVFFDQGKYLLRFTYDTLLQRTVYHDQQNRVLADKLVEWKPKEWVVLYDGKDAYAVTFADRLRPSGCMVEIYDRLPVRDTGFPWRDAARLGQDVTDIDGLIKNLGRDAIRVAERPAGHYVFRYRVKNSPKVRGEFEVARQVGFNVVAWRVFSPKDDKPVTARYATWKRAKGVWYVERMVEELDLRRANEPGSLQRTVFRYDSFEPNAKVDAKRFTLESLGIPDGAQTLDRRP